MALTIMLATTDTVAKSLQLMLNIIVNTHYQDARCIVQLKSTNQSTFYASALTSLDITIPQYVNPDKCVRGCDHYIAHDPLRTRHDYINDCLGNNSEYTFKGITFLENDKIDDYKFNKFVASYRRFPIYSGNAIFIKRISNNFVISAFDHWNLTTSVVLNKWNIFEKKFEDPNIKEFFSDKRRKRRGGVLYANSWYNTMPITAGPEERMGSEVTLMIEFARLMNMSFKLSDDQRGFFLGATGHYGHDLISTYPVSRMDIRFLVPKPRPYIDWLKLVHVFEWKFWALIISCYVLIALIFCAENTIYSRANCPGFTAIAGLFLLQGLNERVIPRYLRPRCLIAALLIVTLLYSSVYSSGVVSKLMTVSYENDIRTIEDFANSNLSIKFAENMNLFMLGHRDTEVERRAFAMERFEMFDSDIHYSKVASAHMTSITRLSSALSQDQSEYLHSVKSMDYIYAQEYSRIVILYNYYLLFVPLLNDFILRSNGAGLMIKWEWDTFRAVNKMADLFEYLDNEPPPSQPTTLKFDHVKGVFAIWIVCIFIAMITFALESLWVPWFYYISDVY